MVELEKLIVNKYSKSVSTAIWIIARQKLVTYQVSLSFLDFELLYDKSLSLVVQEALPTSVPQHPLSDCSECRRRNQHFTPKVAFYIGALSIVEALLSKVLLTVDRLNCRLAESNCQPLCNVGSKTSRQNVLIALHHMISCQCDATWLSLPN